MKKTYELYLPSGSDYMFNGSIFICAHGLRIYFNLPKPLPKTIWLTLSDRRTKESYRVRPGDRDLYIKIENSEFNEYVWTRFYDAIKAFDGRKVYVSVEYEEG